MRPDAIIAWGTDKMKGTDESPLEPGYRYYHGLRVAKLSLCLAEQLQLSVNRDILYIGAFLHDIGKAGYRGPGHGPRGAELIRSEIPGLFSTEELEAVTQIVGHHYNRPKSKYMQDKPAPNYPDEVLIVQDADTLDHFGVNGVWLTFHWAVKDGLTQQAVIDRHYVKDEAWRREAEEWMNFSLCKRELEFRIQQMKVLYTQWKREEQGELTHLS